MELCVVGLHMQKQADIDYLPKSSRSSTRQICDRKLDALSLERSMHYDMELE
jgi:hypothetical protein